MLAIIVKYNQQLGIKKLFSLLHPFVIERVLGSEYKTKTLRTIIDVYTFK